MTPTPPEEVKKEDPKTSKVVVLKDSLTPMQAAEQEVVSEPAQESVKEAPKEPIKFDESKAIPKFDDVKDQKIWQKEQEKKKADELKKQGIDPSSLLTVENLHNWVQKEGNTFAWVARNTGIPEYKVAAFAKSNNIKSCYSKVKENSETQPATEEKSDPPSPT